MSEKISEKDMVNADLILNLIDEFLALANKCKKEIKRIQAEELTDNDKEVIYVLSFFGGMASFPAIALKSGPRAMTRFMDLGSDVTKRAMMGQG